MNPNCISKALFLSALLVASTISFYPSQIHAQSENMTLNCGATLEAETTPDDLSHVYFINVPAGTTLNVRVEPIGNTFNPRIDLYDAAGRSIFSATDGGFGEIEQIVDFEISSSNPSIRIRGGDAGGSNGTFGAYTLYFGCTLRDGTVIEPGDAPPAEQPASNQLASALTISGTGFPGLAPVDFTNAVKLPLIAGMPMSGALTPTGGEIFGFLLDGAAGDKVDLSIARASGNLNLGVAVLSADNKIVFQASLVTSESLSTRFTLPSDGQYTIGVFRIDLLPPDAPEATAFTVQAAINP